MTLFCRDCRFHTIGYPEQTNLCKAEVHDLVTGELISDGPELCQLMRRPDMPCGPDARLFKPPRK